MGKNTSRFNFSKLWQFLKTDIWRIRASTLSGQRSFWIRQLRVLLLAIRGFDEDKCQLRASALTFFSLLSVVPVVAMAFGVAKGFGFEALLEKQILAQLQGQEEVAQQIIQFSQSFLANTQGGVIAGIGIAVLFWSVIKVLGNIENSFNGIWGIKKGRNLGRKLTDYLSIMLICPILLIMSSSVTVLITSQITLIVEKLLFLGPISGWIIAALKLLPYAVIWIVFTFIYIFLPNTTVRFKSGLLAGIIAGTIYQLIQWVYITFQVGAAKYGAIYGSFAALPLFLVWLQVSWLVVLFGAEVSFAEQNVETYEFEPDCLKVSHQFKQRLALGIVHLCVKKFYHSQKPQTAAQIAHQLEIPIRLGHQILFELTECRLLSEVQIGKEREVAYQPAHAIELFTVENVLQALDAHGTNALPISMSEDMKKITQCLENFQNQIKTSTANCALKDI